MRSNFRAISEIIFFESFFGNPNFLKLEIGILAGKYFESSAQVPHFSFPLFSNVCFVSWVTSIFQLSKFQTFPIAVWSW